MRHERRRLLGSFVVPLVLLGATVATVQGGEEPPTSLPAPPEVSDQATYAAHLRPLLDKFCAGCHGKESPAGGVSLARADTVAHLQRDQTTWRKALVQIRERSMPPRGTPQPTEEERDRVTRWLGETLDNAPESVLPKNPGRVLLHRLSRLEYNNTVRDLFGITSRPADAFPVDGGGGGGFDNNADTLFVPPILMERYLEAAGTIVREAPPARVFIVKPSQTLPARAAARKIVAHWAFRAFRRPVEPAEVDRLMGLFDKAMARGDKFEDAVRLALKAVLVSPSFLFRVERDRPGAGAAHALSDYELATRLSYFLWSSLPDDALFRLAGQNKLREPAVLGQQVRRMLKNPKARAFSQSFSEQWLRVRDLYTVARPDPKQYPSFTPTLRDAMARETTLFFDSVLRSENESLLRLLDANYTFLNNELARHYGIEGVSGPDMRRVALTNAAHRGGVLTMASVLTVTSYPRRTSPVLRGKWVLEEILGTPPPPPPPGAGGLPASDAPDKAGLTFRQRLEQHRNKPACASCHARMDPLGFGLENFDATGRWRDKIGNTPVDATGTLATGEKFTGPHDLKKHLLARKPQFVRNVAEKMLAYALGRGLEPYDLPALRKITTRVEQNNCRSQVLIEEIVKSYPFQFRGL